MILTNILYNLILGPLYLLFEVSFVIVSRAVTQKHFVIIFLSVMVNVLLLPLFKRAEELQQDALETEDTLKAGVEHIRKSFTGDERMMVLQEYYRQNNYKPVYALRGSISLLLQIPFFIAAYQFLSTCESIKDVPFGSIASLSAPDGLLFFGGVHINLLPILMTAINLISGTIYLKNKSLKGLIQTYGISLAFLVLLYNSPSGLVLYWTCNNIFSLVRICLTRFPKLKKASAILLGSLGLLILIYGVFLYHGELIKRKLPIIGVGLICILYSIYLIFGRIKHYTEDLKIDNRHNSNNSNYVEGNKLFAICTIYIALLIGILIPSACLKASPQEFIDITYMPNPLAYLISSFSLAVGVFLVWFRIFYAIAAGTGKRIMELLVSILCIVMTVDYMFFGTDLGTLSSDLKYVSGFSISSREIIVNTITVLIIIVLLIILFSLFNKWKSIVVWSVISGIIALILMSGINVYNIHASVNKARDNIDAYLSEKSINCNISRTGKNVVIIVLDRAMGAYIPFIFNEKPELKEKFSGFTWYDNTISFGLNTNFNIPIISGGYEYTPVEMNKRDTEKLGDKHDEALKVLPNIFSANGYEVTLCNPKYAGYQWISDLRIFNDLPDVKAYITMEGFSNPKQAEQVVADNKRNIFMYSILKSMPVFCQEPIYNNGKYNQATDRTQVVTGLSTATGIDPKFYDSYNALLNLKNITSFTDDDKNTFLYFYNDITHSPALLQTPDYIPMQNVDNTEYDYNHEDRFIVNGKKFLPENSDQMIHYHVNVAALLEVGKWLDLLKKEGVYDNTRIIIVADHGAGLRHNTDLIVNKDSEQMEFDAEAVFPLFMVKDFNSQEFNFSSEFMTIADVPSLAVNEIIDNPTNPYTGKTIDMSEKYAHDQLITISGEHSITINNGNCFLPQQWASVHDDIWDDENWEFYGEDIVLKENHLPE